MNDRSPSDQLHASSFMEGLTVEHSSARTARDTANVRAVKRVGRGSVVFGGVMACFVASSASASGDFHTAFEQMVEVCSDPTGAPQSWWDAAQENGWPRVTSDEAASIYIPRVAQQLMYEHVLTKQSGRPDPNKLMPMVANEVNLLKAEEQQRASKEGQGEEYPTSLYAYQGNPRLSVKLPLNEEFVGLGLPTISLKCTIFYDSTEFEGFVKAFDTVSEPSKIRETDSLKLIEFELPVVAEKGAASAYTIGSSSGELPTHNFYSIFLVE